jgi:hypothetical protein
MEDSSNKIINNIKYLSEVINEYGKNIPTEISSALKEILEKELKDINFENDMLNKNSMSTVVHDYMKKISPTLKNLSGKIAEVLILKMQSEYDLKKKSQK